jgi:hypothetical protein
VAEEEEQAAELRERPEDEVRVEELPVHKGLQACAGDASSWRAAFVF